MKSSHLVTRRAFLAGSGVVALALAGCGATSQQGSNGAAATTSGSSDAVVIGETSLLKSIAPTDTSTPWDLTSDGISEGVFMQDSEGKLFSNYLTDLKAGEGNSWTATVKGDMKFSDGSPVDADALVACLTQIQQENSLATQTLGKIEFKKTGDTQLAITPEKATATMDSVLCEWHNIVFKKDGDSYLFSGPYQVKNLNPGVELQLEPNPSYPDADKRPAVTIKAFEDANTMQQAFESGEVDMAFTVTADAKEALEQQGKKVTDFDAGYQYMGYVNTSSDVTKDSQVRQAMNLALDRDAMVSALKGGQPATGVFAHYYSFAGKSEVARDLDKAKSLLDAAGWKAGDDGVRTKDGAKLTVRLVTYASRPDLPVIMQLAASQLKEAGFDPQAQVVDAIDDTGKAGDFELMFYAQHTAPTGNPTSFLAMTFQTDGTKNFSRYSNSQFDSTVTEMAKKPNGSELDQLAVEAQDILFQDLPVLYLVDPQWHVAVSDKFADYKPYCGDYYVVNNQLVSK